jgi:hypothetical protein
VQLYRDPTATPIEDSTVLWPDDASPPIVGARLVIERQDVASDRGAIAAFVEKLSFDPWHALVEHRPLGAMMRARNHAYRLSTAERGARQSPTTARRSSTVSPGDTRQVLADERELLVSQYPL